MVVNELGTEGMRVIVLFVDKGLLLVGVSLLVFLVFGTFGVLGKQGGLHSIFIVKIRVFIILI